MLSIVSKTGDQGETGLFNGRRVKKSDISIEILGDLDELSAQLGLIRYPKIQTPLQRIQGDLFSLGALLAGWKAKDFKKAKGFKKAGMCQALKRIEKELDPVERRLAPLTNFIFPGGHPEAAQLHLARALCRRAERHLVKLKDSIKLKGPLNSLPECALPYLNRLSDYLFLLARKVNQESKTKERIWKKIGSPIVVI